jgi:hypothetical protein
MSDTAKDAVGIDEKKPIEELRDDDKDKDQDKDKD